MAAAPFVARPPIYSPAPKRENTPPAIRLLRAIYQGQDGGYFELQVIDGDPSQKGIHTTTPANVDRWQQWQPNSPAWLAEFTRTVEQLTARYGNVYVSRTCYTEPKRSAAAAMPSYAVFIDDAPVGLYTFTVQTSPKSKHGWLLTSESMDVQTYSDLARRAAKNADHSGSDIQQLVRLPGTYNTKLGQRWEVTLEPGTNRRYTLAELQLRWPALPVANAQPSTLDAAQVDYYLTNVTLLLNRYGYPKKLKIDGPGVDVLKQGERVADRSVARYSVAKSLYLHGYPDAEIAALLLHFCDYGHSQEKGWHEVDKDIARIIGKLHGLYPNVPQSPTRLSGDIQPTRPRPVIERQRGCTGRPRKLTADELLAFYQSSTDGSIHSYRAVSMRCKEVAAKLHISLRTLRALDGQLLLRGEAERITPANRKSSYVILLKDAENGAAKTPKNASFGGSAKTPFTTIQLSHINAPFDAFHSEISKTDQIPIGEHTPHTLPGAQIDAPSAHGTALVDASGPAPATGGTGGVCSPPRAVIRSNREWVRLALQAYGSATKYQRSAKVETWVQAYLAAECIVIAPSSLAALIKSERKYVGWLARLAEMSLAEIAKSGRYYQRKGYKRELADIAAEYARRGIDPASLTTRKRAPKVKTAALPLLDTPQEMTAIPAVIDSQPGSMVNVVNPPASSECPSSIPAVDGWQYLLNPEGQAGWRGIHTALGQTGLYISRDGVERAIAWGSYS